MRRLGLTVIALVAAIAAPMAGSAAPPPPETPFTLLQALCMTPEANPNGVGKAALAAGFHADPTNSMRFLAGEGTRLVTVSAIPARPQTSEVFGPFEIRTCMMTIKDASPADLAELWKWTGYEYKSPWSAYLILDPPDAYRKVDGKMVPMNVHEVAKNQPAWAKLALRQGRLRLMSVTELDGGGLRLVYGVLSEPKK
ncbi:hypothetical protein BH11PSE2_BH11PSE2_10810 [soil metagenome]